MSNSIPASGGTLPDPNKLATGQALRSDEVIYIPEMLNHSLNSARCQPVISQAWADSVCRYQNAGGTYTDVANWRIPVLTDSHTTLGIVIHAGAGGGTGTANVRFTSTGSGLTYTFAIGAVGFYFTPLPVGLTTAAIGATDYDEITMSFSAAGASNEAVVDSVTVFYGELATATLPAQLIDGAEPFGVGTSFDPDYPLPASMGKRMIEALAALRLRPRVMYSWSGLSAAVATYTSGEASETMADYEHWLSSVVNPGDSDKDLTIWVHTRADAVSATEVRISQWRIDVPAGAGDVWRQAGGSQILYLENSRFPNPNQPVFTMPQSEWKSLILGAKGPYSLKGTPVSSAGILSVAIWGS